MKELRRLRNGANKMKKKNIISGRPGGRPHPIGGRPPGRPASANLAKHVAEGYVSCSDRRLRRGASFLRDVAMSVAETKSEQFNF